MWKSRYDNFGVSVAILDSILNILTNSKRKNSTGHFENLDFEWTNGHLQNRFWKLNWAGKMYLNILNYIISN